MPSGTVREAVRRFGGSVSLEASGGIHLGNVEEYARTGVAAISVGALTHSAPALDLSFELAP
jgi:nicotinate-nucleotide pyrophosphorylase (carboxylating)